MPSERPSPELLDTEELSRFILDRGYYKTTTEDGLPFISWKAFGPSGDDHSTSVYRVGGLFESAIWNLGDERVAIPRRRTLKARADLTVAIVRAHAPLSVEPDEPPERHAIILGWPGAMEKDAIKSLAMELAADAKLIVKPAA